MSNKLDFITDEYVEKKKTIPNYNLKKKKELLTTLEQAHYTIAKLRLENIELVRENAELKLQIEELDQYE